MSKKSGKELHPLFNTWSHYKRRGILCEAWAKDFVLFTSEVGERKENHRLHLIVKTEPLSISNFHWMPIKQSIKDYESRNAYMREYMKNNRDKQKIQDLKKRFNITLEQYREMQKQQNNVCAICGSPEIDIDNRTQKVRDLAVDHCHTTHKVRGLLCRGCNQGLGNFKDNTQFLHNAINYLTDRQ